MIQILIVAFGTAGVAFSFDSLFNDEPEYLKYFDNEIWRIKDHFKDEALNIKSLIEKKEGPVDKIIEMNVAALSQNVKGLSSSIDGFADSFNKNKYSIADSHLSTKRAMYLIFSFFVIFYIKFLVDLYRHNTNQIAHEQAFLDALRLCTKNEENLPPTVDLNILKEILPLLHIKFGSDGKTDPILDQILSKIGGKA